MDREQRNGWSERKREKGDRAWKINYDALKKISEDKKQWVEKKMMREKKMEKVHVLEKK